MTELEKQAMYNMLTEIKRLAASASLTGALRKGTPTLIGTYNKCLAALREKGDKTATHLFADLAPDASVDNVGVAAALLASYLRPEGHKGRGLHPHDLIAFQEDHNRHEFDEED
jgi:hypothetical protein